MVVATVAIMVRLGAIARGLGSALVLFLVFGATSAVAQVGVTTDIIMGTVTDSTGQPVVGAVVEVVSLETGISRSATTGSGGRYRILFPDGGGRYQLFSRFIGMTPVRRVVQRESDDDRIVANVQLASSPVQLADLTSRGRRGRRGNERPTPGSVEAVQTPDRLARLPIDAGDLNAIAGLAPGVVPVDGTDSTAAGFSVAGQRPSANTTTLDGLDFGASSIPQDAVRNTRVITNTYDVARGQFSGGLVAATTRSGTNVFQSTLTSGLRDPSLAVVPDSAVVQPQAQQQLSFGLGGPFIRNRLFGFAAGQIRHRDSPLLSPLSVRNNGDAERFGIAPDSLDRYLDVLQTLGVPLGSVDLPGSRNGVDWSGIARVDWLLGDAHTLTFRGDLRRSTQEPVRTGPLTLVTSGGRTTAWGGGGLVQLSSRVGQSFVNEAKAYLSTSANDGDGFLELPRGRVLMTSTLPDGRLGASSLVFGGSPSFPSTSRSTSFEASDELSWISADASHRVKLGSFYTTARTTQEISDNLLGTFTFQSLADLMSQSPATFTRTLAPTERAGRSSTAAFYLGDTWRTSSALQLIYGVRAEHSWFGDAPAYNPLVDSLFGLRTDRLPVETHLSPRAGFTWAPRPPDGPAVWSVRGGFGEFRSPIPTRLAVYAQSATGLTRDELQVVCAGDAVPTPDWSEFAADPATIPTECVNGTSRDSALNVAAPVITAFTPGFTAPRVWRGSLGLQRRVGLLTLSLDASAGIGVSQSGFEDRNLGSSRFTLSNEGGRPIYVDPDVIDPVSGNAPLLASRRDARFGQVFAEVSNLTTRSSQVVAAARGVVGSGIALSASYTWSRATDESSDDIGRTLRESQRTFSSFDRRHQFVVTAGFPIVRGLEMTSIGRLVSGTPFTPEVAGDLNADGARNDRAFIFDPAAPATDPTLAASLTRLLDASSGRVRDCLTRQLGAIAGRNSCRGPWQPSLDFQMNWRPPALDQRLTVSLLTSNLMAGLDQLFHGEDNLHGWGLAVRPDPTLLTIEGFDPATTEFRYAVNEHFGAAVGNQSTLRQPFQVGVQLRLALGGAPRIGGVNARGGNGGFPGGGRGARDNGSGPISGGAPSDSAAAANPLGDRLARVLPDPIQPILELDMTLKLTDPQMTQLDSIQARFVAARDSLGQAMLHDIDRTGYDDRAAVFRAIRSKIKPGRMVAQAALDEAQKVLTAQQWDALPAKLKRPADNFGR